MAKPTVVIPCTLCGKERTLIRSAGSSGAYLKRHPICRKCGNKQITRQGNKSYAWRGGRTIHRGYVLVTLDKNDFFYPMADKRGYVLEHRLVMAKSLGRCLQSWELVHHKGIRSIGIENKSDNLRDNLEMSASIGEHSLDHSKGYKDGYAKGLQDGQVKQMGDILKEIRLLRWENKQLREQTEASSIELH